MAVFSPPARGPTEPTLRTEGLRRVFGGTGATDATGASGQTVALEGLDLEVAPGELFGIVGPDGAGKTTTLRMLAGVLAPSGGDAWILGESLVDDPERAKPHTAYMPQRFGLYEDLTVAENLDFYADLYRVPKTERPARLERLYRFSRLDEFKDRLAGNLSGGMKQKLALSCALIHQPKLLLLDEPTFGVDPISRRDLWLILHEMVDEGVTVVVSTSYLDEAERCDRVALLSEGRLLALDTPAGLVERAPGRIVEVKTARPREDRDRLRAVDGIEGALLFGDRIHVTLRDGVHWEQVAGRLESAAPGSGVQVLEARPAEASLEDVFLALVERAEAA